MADHDPLNVVDTSKVLTLDELSELKKLAAMSKIAKGVIAMVIGAIALLGIDKVIDLVQKGHV